VWSTMGFLAGWVCLDGPLDADERNRFQRAVREITAVYPWPLRWTMRNHCVLAQAQFPRMWQGERVLSGPAQTAIAVGVQWKKYPGRRPALHHLARDLAGGREEKENRFDYFLCALVQDEPRRVVLATDPVGIAPLYYHHDDRRILFSTHQRLFHRLLDGPAGALDPDAVLQFLLIGHALGERTFHRGVTLLPPGAMLSLGPGTFKLEPAAVPFAGGKGSVPRDVREAARALLDHLEEKGRHYLTLADRPLAGLLSGGWDSRLLAALFAGLGALSRTFTTQQQTRIAGRLVSEKKIAREVARHLGLRNRFVPPRYRTPRTRRLRLVRLDASTWFHDWAFHLADTLPVDTYLLCDGLLGDILLRGLYHSPALQTCVRSQDRPAACDLLLDSFVQGFNPYTRGLAHWERVLRPDLLRGFKRRLREEILADLSRIPQEDFVTAFLIRNRTRRGITPLPLFIFGARGVPLLPFVDRDFLETALGIPWAWKRDLSLFRALLEGLSPGLSGIPSTNSRDMDALAPYLCDSVRELSLRGRARAWWVRSRLSAFPGFIRSGPDPGPGPLAREWVRKEILTEILGGGGKGWRAWGFFMDRLAMVDDYFS